MGDTTIAWTDKVKRCSACKAEHALSEFGRDRTQPDGLATKCLKSRRVKVRRKPGYPIGYYRHGWIKQARNGDRKQARRRINYLVEQKRITHPNTLPCEDCGHIWDGSKRHEYDHHLGYGPEHQLDVEVVCSSCHHQRERARLG